MIAIKNMTELQRVTKQSCGPFSFIDGECEPILRSTVAYTKTTRLIVRPEDFVIVDTEYFGIIGTGVVSVVPCTNNY